MVNDEEKDDKEKDEVSLDKSGNKEVYIINTKTKADINVHNIDTDKDTFKLINEEPNIATTPSHDNDSLATLSTSVKDHTCVTSSSPSRTENPPSKVNIAIV